VRILKATKKIQEYMDMIAQGFGATTARKVSAPCRGKYAGTVDYSLLFDNGEWLSVCNSSESMSFDRCVAELAQKYNPEAILKTKRVAFEILQGVQSADYAIAKENGLPPYILESVELKKCGHYLGWYYLVLSVNGKQVCHIETGLDYAIKNHNPVKVSKTYYCAHRYKEDEIDYVFAGVGHKIRELKN